MLGNCVFLFYLSIPYDHDTTIIILYYILLSLHVVSSIFLVSLCTIIYYHFILSHCFKKIFLKCSVYIII